MTPSEPGDPQPGMDPSTDPPSASKSDDGTAVRILDAAERLFADRGFAAVSMRMITSASGANLAAANYHFGTKEGLYEAVFARRILPINEDRLRRLNEALDQNPERETRLRSIVEAYVRPLLSCCETNEGCDSFVIMRFLAKVILDLTQHVHLVSYYDEMRNSFLKAIHQCLHELNEDEVFFHYNSMVAVTLFYALGDPAHMVREQGTDSTDTETAIAMLSNFINLGMQPANEGAALGVSAGSL